MAASPRFSDPSPSRSWKHSPLAAPISSLLFNFIRSAKTRSIVPVSQDCRRCSIKILSCGSRMSSAITEMPGRRGAVPDMILAMSTPFHWRLGILVPLATLKTNSLSVVSEICCVFRDISTRNARNAAFATARAASPSMASSNSNFKPFSRPTGSPSISTSPFLRMAAIRSGLSLSLDIRAEVFRFTNRCVNRSCSASESLSSIARVWFCQCS